MAALQPISITPSPVLNQTGRSPQEHLVDFYSWSAAKQDLITARVKELPDQGDPLDQNALQIMLNIQGFQQILNRNASSIADVYPYHLKLNGTNEADPTEILKILKAKDPEEKKGLYALILGILAYQILFSKDEIADNDKHFLFFNFVHKLLVNIPENHLLEFFKALEDVVKPDDDTCGHKLDLKIPGAFAAPCCDNRIPTIDMSTIIPLNKIIEAINDLSD